MNNLELVNLNSRQALPPEDANSAAKLETAVRQRASDVIASQSIRVRGPVLSGAMDTKTGAIFFVQNTGMPDPLHPDPGAAG